MKTPEMVVGTRVRVTAYAADEHRPFGWTGCVGVVVDVVPDYLDALIVLSETDQRREMFFPEELNVEGFERAAFRRKGGRSIHGSVTSLAEELEEL